MEEPDPQIVAAARRGDLAAFEKLVRRCQPDIWRLCFSLLRDESLADDACQDAFVRAYRFLPRYRGDSKFTTWLFSIARNCALDELRRADRRRKTARALADAPAPQAPDHSARIEVRDALAALPDELRECEVLIDMFGLPYDEVARIVGIPLGTVKSRVHRARVLLAAALEPPEGKVHGEA